MPGPREKKYHQIADEIRHGIKAGEFPAGSRLPAETVIAQSHDTSVPTVRQAMSVLRNEGLIESRHGIGTFVLSDDRTDRIERRTIPADPDARKRWVEEFTDDIMQHPHDDFTTWILREER